MRCRTNPTPNCSGNTPCNAPNRPSPRSSPGIRTWFIPPRVRQTGSPELAREIAQSVFTDLGSQSRALADSSKLDASLAGLALSQHSLRYADPAARRAPPPGPRKAVYGNLHPRFRGRPETGNASLPSSMRRWPNWTTLTAKRCCCAISRTRISGAVGGALGVSDVAAQKRVSRAVERLREFFAQRGVSVGASGLALVISANAVQTAPDWTGRSLSAAAARRRNNSHHDRHQSHRHDNDTKSSDHHGARRCRRHRTLRSPRSF